MLEILAFFIIGWFIGRIIVATINVHRKAMSDPLEVEDLEEHYTKYKVVTVATIKVEEINGWWYGFHKTAQGGEIFIAQGTTFEEAVTNCKQRFSEKPLLKDIPLVFQKQSA